VGLIYGKRGAAFFLQKPKEEKHKNTKKPEGTSTFWRLKILKTLI